jgi:hypothetical protein
LKKILKEGAQFTGDLSKIFPEYYNKYFLPIRKKNDNEFVLFKYFTDDEKGDDEESEENESKDFLLKEIELMFENMYFYKVVGKIPSFYKANIERINLLYTQFLDESFKRNPTLNIQKDTGIYKSRQEEIEIIEKRRTLRKAIKVIKKCEKKK